MEVNKIVGGGLVEPRDEGTEEGRDEGIPSAWQVSQYLLVIQQGGK